jgi:hypothetical protein
MKSLEKIASVIFCVVMLFSAASTAVKAVPVIELTLNGVPLIVYFTDRPYRKAGHLSLEDFAKEWKGDAKKHGDDPPNGELAIYQEGGDTHAVLIVSKPKISKTAISFSVKVYDGNMPKTFGHATLFIDSIPTMVNGQITD